MADNAQLDAFLGGAPQEGAPEPAEPRTEAPKPEADTKARPEITAPSKAPEAAAPEPTEEDVAPHTGSDNRTVPFSALEKVRNDWKSKYAAEQARAELLAKQLEEARKPPAPVQQPAPQPQYVAIDPVQDPQGYHQRIQGMLINERLNQSELQLRKELGGEKVDALVAEFKDEAARDPSLFSKLYSQLHPYEWAAKHLETVRLQREIGDDPAGYRARIEAEARAKWEAESGQQPNGSSNGHAPSPAAGLPPSLASARSVAGRTASPFTGPPSIESLFPGHNRRAEQRR